VANNGLVFDSREAPFGLTTTLCGQEKQKIDVAIPINQNKANVRFEQIGKQIGRDEVAVAAIFYGQAKASVPSPIHR
jgi:hypothetical protein